MEQMATTPGMLHVNDIYEHLCAIGKMLNREDPTPAPGEIDALIDVFGATPPENVQKLFPLLRSYEEAAAIAPGPIGQNGETASAPSTIEEPERESARQELDAALFETMLPYRRAIDSMMEERDESRSPECIAALMAPREENAMLMQRMEESSLRQLWRLSRIFWMIKRQTDEGEIPENAT